MNQDYRKASVQILFLFESKNLRLQSIRKRYFSDTSMKASLRFRIAALTNKITRLRGRLDYIIEKVSNRKIKQIDIKLRNILRVTVFETLFDKAIPEYAAVNSGVNMAKDLLSPKAAKFTNAILRRMLRLIELESEWLRSLAQNNKWHSIPEWLLRRWTNRFSKEELQDLITIMNQSPPIHIRFNPKIINTNQVISSLEKEKIETKAINTFEYYLLVSRGAGRILSSDLFQNGLISIQDPAAGAVVELLDPVDGNIVSDVCAAPGTKSLLIAEKLGRDGKIFASDIDPKRVKMGLKDIKRHGLKNIHWSIQNACNNIFNNSDKILVDVPCTGTGVMARKPDIRWRRGKKDIKQFVKLQFDILNNVTKYLNQGGELVYSTCSIEQEENRSEVERFLNLNTDFTLVPASSNLPDAWVNEMGCMQTFPHLHGVDGMFAAKIKRI